jgi:hypothetical protein
MRVEGGDRVSKPGRVACVFLLCLVSGCAGMLAGGRRLDPTSETGRAWQALVDGKDDEAALMFGRVLVGANGESRSLALFGAGSLAYERGDDEAATAFYLDLIEAAAGSGDARDGLLAEAAAVRLPRLLDELPDRRAAWKARKPIRRTGATGSGWSTSSAPPAPM